MKKQETKKLGKGLGALMGGVQLDKQLVAPGPIAPSPHAPPAAGQPAASVKSELVKEIPLSEIEPNPQQPRSMFSEEALEELSNSVKQFGIIQPITVRTVDGGKYQIISGERRYRASKMLELETIPAYVREADDNDSLLMALIENVQRTDLDAIEIALSYQRLIDELRFTQEEISEKVGKKRSTVANYLRLMKLPDEIQRAIREQLISMGHARALINISSVTQQVSIAKKIVEQGLSVRQVEELVKLLDKPKEKKPQPPSEDGDKKLSESLLKLVEGVEKCFNGKVNAKRGLNGGAKLTIDLKTDDDIRSATGKLSSLLSESTV